jgi:outer membrane protein assembly factor BamA
VLYFRHGYRQARVESAVTPAEEGVQVAFQIAEGPLTTVAALDVLRPDSLLSEGHIAEAGLPGPGDPLNLVQMDSARLRLRARLWDLGHADGRIVDSLTIDTLTHAAHVRVAIDPGPSTVIGAVRVEGEEGVSERTILRLFDLGPGDPFRRTDMTEAQRRLYETELFRQSLVQVPATEDSAKTVVIRVQEAPPRAIRVGPGFNTTEYLQGEARYTRYDWMGGARRLDARLAVGNLLAPQLYGQSFLSSTPPGVSTDVEDVYLAPTWQVGVDMIQPFFFSSRTSLGVGVSAHRRSIPGIVIDRGVTGRVTVTRRVMDRAPVSLGYRFEQTRVRAEDVYYCTSFGICDPPTIASLDQPHRLSPLVLTGLVERTDDVLAPTSGYMARLELEHASALTLSDFRYLRAAGEASRYLKLGDRVLAGRVRAGWVRPQDGIQEIFGLPDEGTGLLHPRRRFFAGGSRSARGYGENQLGPRVLTVAPQELLVPADTTRTACTVESIADATCDPNVAPSSVFLPRPLGGNTLLEASVEYRLPLTGTITGAVFVDAALLRGQRLNFPPGTRSAVTPGLGVRYLSPIGPVRLDLGLRPARVEELPVVTQLRGEDGELRLVQLETLMRYDPLGDASGIGGFFRRLQLHLAIGEAF